MPTAGSEDSAASSPRASAPPLHGATSSGTGTNVQEAGVDEPDVVKSDGSILVRIDDHVLTTYDVSGAEPRRLGSVDVPREIADPELLLAGSRVVVLGEESDHEFDHEFYPMDQTSAVTHQLDIDISDPSSPTVTDQRSYDARLISARQHGDVVRLVLGSGLPDLDFVEPWGFRTEKGAEKRNREIVSKSTIEDWVPSVTTDGGSDPAGRLRGHQRPRRGSGNRRRLRGRLRRGLAGRDVGDRARDGHRPRLRVRGPALRGHRRGAPLLVL